MKLKNRVVVVSGATGGLGQVVTKSMASEGAKLVLLGRTTERLNQLASELHLGDDDALTLAVDLRTLDGAESVMEATQQKFGKADILLQLVGGWTGGKSIAEVDPNDVASMFQQHAWTTFHLAQAFIPHFVENSWGRIVAISSPNAATPRAKGGPYAMGKAAQEALMLTLAQELKGTGVTSNILLVKTIDVAHKRDRKSAPQNASWTTPEEIAEAIMYLISEEARMVNGARLPLYGSP
jgi:NAD(P)-dependent dehydrogenase (short-subunit alcohol dehydrogenase family)